MFLYSHIGRILSSYFIQEHELELEFSELQFVPTRKDFEGDYTLVVFPLVRYMKASPEECGTILGDLLIEKSDYIQGFNVVKGFLNLSLSGKFWRDSLKQCLDPVKNSKAQGAGKLVIEYSSPNTNKPLHLGHIRNILIGWSIYKILERRGHEVIKTQIVNDRGVAICKSMLAWKLFSGGETPESSGKKGDHLIGEYYVKFDQELNEEYETWQNSEEGKKYFEQNSGDTSREVFFKKFKNTYFNDFSKLGAQVREMLIDWEKGKKEIVYLWETMNSWVYNGFEQTYSLLGVDFNKTYYESDTYKLGKELVTEGLKREIFYREKDGSVWVDLESSGMDKKLLMRSDGTSVYITQDLGTARIRFEDFEMEKMVYVVGNEQDYHFQVLFEILKMMGEPYAGGLYHLSYGMVDLPTGKMKSREGTVVDADDLIEDVIRIASENVVDRGDMSEVTKEEKLENIRRIGMGALKFQLLKINPKKRMVFQPEESVDMQGHTGPYIQNAYVRIHSILRKVGDSDFLGFEDYLYIAEEERELIKQLLSYEETVVKAAGDYDPSHLANFTYQLARSYHRFYHEHPILKADSEDARNFRIQLSTSVANTLQDAMELLGINMPTRM